jgi:subtilisin family serine protease
MASPHVAGVAALYKDTYGDAPSSTIDSWIKANATSTPYGRLLYTGGL